MELKEGYKNTEVGTIPNGWNVKELSQLGIFTKGRGISKDEASSGSIPSIRYGEIYTKHNEYVKEYFSFISQEVANNAHKLKFGDILFAGSGETKEEIGKCVAFIDKQIAYAGGDIVILSPKDTLSLYLGYLLNTENVRKQKANKGQGDAIVHINANQLSQIKIPLPPTTEEQQTIATALSDIDTLITRLDKLITKKKAIKQGAMQQLLKAPYKGGKRLPGFEGEWEELELRNLLKGNPQYGINAPAVEFNENLPLYLRITDISDSGEYIKTGKVSVNHKDYEHFILKEGEMVFARTGASVGKTYLCNPKDGLLVYAGFLIKVTPDPKKLNPKYLKAFTQTKTYWHWVAIMSMRSGQPGINGNEYGSLLVPIPPTIEEQNSIAELLSDMDKEIESLESKKSKYLLIKQGMMQELLIGKTRIV